MQEVWIRFLGICTHVELEQLLSPPSPAWGHRIVLPNASNPDTILLNDTLKGHDIWPHVARLQVGFDQVVSIEGPNHFYPYYDTLLMNLTGMSLQIINGIGNVEGPETAHCLPHLSAWMPGLLPGPAVTSDNAALAAAYFDFYVGTLRGVKLPTEMAIGEYTMNTFGDPQLLIAPFGGGPPTIVTLHNPGVGSDGQPKRVGLILMNLPIGGSKDNDADFLLNYIVASGFPPPGTVPLVESTCEADDGRFEKLFPYHWIGAPADAGPGCSNSNLP